VPDARSDWRTVPSCEIRQTKMHLTDVIVFSASALRGHRLRTWLSMLGVAIGVASVVLLTSLGEGARQYVIEEFASLGTNMLIVIPGKIETTGGIPAFGATPRDLTLGDMEEIQKRLPEVQQIAPLVPGQATIRYATRRRDVTVVGTTHELQGVRNLHINIGRYLPPGDTERGAHVCVIGPRIQRELFPGTNPLGEILRIGDERYRVIGVTAPRGMSLGMDLDDVVHIPVIRALKMFNREGVFRLLIGTRSHDEPERLKKAVTEILIERHDGVEDVTLITQDSVISTFGRILAILTAVLVGIAAISLSVAGIGIMNVMLVSVSERTREIGLLKSIGASPGQVLAAFLVEAAILSTMGGAAGLLVAFTVTWLLRRAYPSFPMEAPVWAVLASILVSISVGMIFGALPARRASRLDPVAALARR